MTDRTDNAPASPGLSNDGTRGSAPPRCGHPPSPDVVRSSSPPTGRPGKRGVKVGTKLGVVPVGRRGQRAHYQHGTCRQTRDPGAHQVAKAAFDPVAHRRAAHRPGDHETRPRRIRTRTKIKVNDQSPARSAPATPDRGGEIAAPAQPVRGRQHLDLRGGSGGEAPAALGSAVVDDRAAGAGAHPQPEAVGLRPPAIVGLEGALAHVRLRGFVDSRAGKYAAVHSAAVPGYAHHHEGSKPARDTPQPVDDG
jgi:hypothetical protein